MYKKIAILLVAALLCAGAIYQPKTYEYIEMRHPLPEGQGTDAVAAMYYDDNKDGRSWQEFRHDVMTINKRTDGGQPQPGDLITVIVAKETEKND